MTIREQIIAMQLSCNLERALLLILDNCGCDETLLISDLGTIEWDIQSSLTANTKGKEDAVVVGDATKFGIKTRNIDLAIKTVGNEWLNYTPKVYLERYKAFRQKGEVSTGNYTDVKAGFVREDFRGGNLYNRVNEFTGIVEQNMLDIKMQTYFRHQDNGEIYALGVPKDFSTYNVAKQIFRFALELDVNGKTIKLNSPTFQVIPSWDYNTNGFYYGVGYAYGASKI